jgi:excisionase family DNA binding protein
MNANTQNLISLTNPTNATSDKLLLRVGNAAKLCDLSRSTMYSLIHQGLVPAIRIGNSIRISVDDLRNWIANQPQVSG